MNNLNSQRLENIKNGESVFEALLHLGGKATFSDLLKRIARSVSQPEDVIRPEVKTVLRASVMNGYLVRHGKNYLLSRSCRTLYTDSSSSGKREEFVEESSFRTFGFPIWWNRFWNRFVVCKEKDSARNAKENPLNCNEPHSSCSSELNDLESVLELETEAESNQADTPKDIIETTDYASDSLNTIEENVVGNCDSISPPETEANEPKSNSLFTIAEPNETETKFESIFTDGRPVARRKELETISARHSIVHVHCNNCFCIDEKINQNDDWMD